MSEEIKEINRIIQSISDFYKMDNALKYYLDRQKANILLNYITNLQQKVEQLENIIKENENSTNILIDKYNQLENIRKEAIKYITSYESIETIQQCEHSENNKKFR